MYIYTGPTLVLTSLHNRQQEGMMDLVHDDEFEAW